MKLERAEKLANKLIRKLAHPSLIVVKGGSIRRKRPDVKDIELIIVPPPPTPPPSFSNDLDDELELLAVNGKILFIKNGSKYKQFWLTKKDGTRIIKADLFIVTPPAHFGTIYVIRTGSAAFSKWIVNCRKDKGFMFHKGALYRNEKLVPTPTELSVFEALQIEYSRPEQRESKLLDFNSLKKDWEEWTIEETNNG